MAQIDEENGEIMDATPFDRPASPPRMPPEIAAAILKVKAGVTKLGFDERNEHGKYSYASIDKFYTACRPLEVEAQLAVVLDESSFDIRAGDSGKGWVFIRYDAWLVHGSGVMWGPLRRHVAAPATGPQTFGALESYVHKAFRRGLYMVPTGEKDGDDAAPRDDAPMTARQTASRMTPAVQKPSDARAVANAVVARIRSDIKNARSIAELNRTGIYGKQADADKELILAQDGGGAVWDNLVQRDVDRRFELEGAQSVSRDPVEYLGA